MPIIDMSLKVIECFARALVALLWLTIALVGILVYLVYWVCHCVTSYLSRLLEYLRALLWRLIHHEP